MSLAVVAPIRSRPLLESPQDIVAFEQDLLSEFVLGSVVKCHAHIRSDASVTAASYDSAVLSYRV
ncbi:hypothetical protein, partial [Streptomyces bacillaris]